MSDYNVYKKITRDDVDLPRYCYYFIKEIQDSLDEHDIKDPGDELDVTIETSAHPYCSDAFALVVKTFERKNYSIKYPTFKVKAKKGGEKIYSYNWILKKLGSYTDDLPF